MNLLFIPGNTPADASAEWRTYTNGVYITSSSIMGSTIIINSSDTLDEILAAVPVSGTTIVIPPGVSEAARTLSATSNRTLPAGVLLEIVIGVPIVVPVGRTFTINGVIDAGPYQIFSGAGTVTINTVDMLIYGAWSGSTGGLYSGELVTDGLVVTTGKTLTVQNTLTLAGTDASTLDIGTGGTLGTAAYTAAGAYAIAGKGVTNGDTHDHAGGDGAQIDHGGLGGLADDDHTQYIKHALATAGNDFLVASGAGTFVKKTLAETQAIIGTLPFSTQSVVTGTRAVDGTVYQNTTGKTMFVTVSLQFGVGTSVQAFTDANAAPITAVTAAGSGNGPGVDYGAVSFMVLSGNYYKVVETAGAALSYWVEWY